MVEWQEMTVGNITIDIAVQNYDNSEWLVFADQKLDGGDHQPYSTRVSNLSEAREEARKLANSPHPNNSDITLEYIEISEVTPK